MDKRLISKYVLRNRHQNGKIDHILAFESTKTKSYTLLTSVELTPNK
jgi:hypothetical protein